MKYDISHITQKVRLVVKDTSEKSEKRRLQIFNEVSCKIGCNHCCSRAIPITLAEASVIRDSLIKSKKWSQVLQKSRDLSVYDDIDAVTWFKMNIKCPVLDVDTGKCMAYEVRPVICSTHFVSSDPNSCSPWEFGHMNYIQVDTSSILESATDEIYKICGNNAWSSITSLHKALVIADSISEVSGLDFDGIIKIMARNQ